MNDNLKNAFYGLVYFKILEEGMTSGIFNMIANNTRCTINKIFEHFKMYNPMKLSRFLNAAVAIDLLGRNQEYYYVPSEHIIYFDNKSDKCIRNMVKHMEDNTYYKLKKLDEILSDQFEMEAVEVFDSVYSDDEAMNSFLEAMWCIGYEDSLNLAGNPFMKTYNKLIDIGGGSGSFSVACIMKNKVKEAVVFDLPKVESYINNKKKLLGLENQLYFQGGDYFKDELPRADAYALGYILSDWDDETSSLILDRIYQRMEVGDEILILERLFEESRSAPLDTAIMDLCMLVETKGRHRTFHEYSALLVKAGFRDIELIRSQGDKHLIKGRRLD